MPLIYVPIRSKIEINGPKQQRSCGVLSNAIWRMSMNMARISRFALTCHKNSAIANRSRVSCAHIRWGHL